MSYLEQLKMLGSQETNHKGTAKTAKSPEPIRARLARLHGAGQIAHMLTRCEWCVNRDGKRCRVDRLEIWSRLVNCKDFDTLLGDGALIEASRKATYPDEFILSFAEPEDHAELRARPAHLEAFRRSLLNDSRFPNALPRFNTVDAVDDAGEASAAILDHDGRMAREAAERTARLAKAFYDHIFGVAASTKCCVARHGRYCNDGKRLKDEYYEAASTRA